jgi:hypothetical protein
MDGGREGTRGSGVEWNGMAWEERISVLQLNNCNVVSPCVPVNNFITI